MYCYTHCLQPCSRPPPNHTSTGYSWTLTLESGSVFCGVTAPFSWVLVHTRFCLCPPRVFFPVLFKSGSCVVELMVTYSKSEAKLTQSCPTLCDAMDYTVHGILQARILEWVTFSFSRGSSQPRDQTQVSCIAGSPAEPQGKL